MNIQDISNRIEAAKNNLQEARNNFFPGMPIPDPVVCPGEDTKDGERSDAVLKGAYEGFKEGTSAARALPPPVGWPAKLVAGGIGAFIGGVEAGNEYDAENVDKEEGCPEPPVA